MTCVLKWCEDKKFFQYFSPEGQRVTLYLDNEATHSSRGRGVLTAWWSPSRIKMYGYLKNASSKNDFCIESDKRGFLNFFHIFVFIGYLLWTLSYLLESSRNNIKSTTNSKGFSLGIFSSLLLPLYIKVKEKLKVIVSKGKSLQSVTNTV